MWRVKGRVKEEGQRKRATEKITQKRAKEFL